MLTTNIRSWGGKSIYILLWNNDDGSYKEWDWDYQAWRSSRIQFVLMIGSNDDNHNEDKDLQDMYI